MKRIAVLGAGTMGHGIAHAAIAGGYETRMYDVSDDAVGKGRAAVDAIVRKGVELGKVTPSDADAMLRRLTATSSLGEALQDADFVIEAAPEKIDLKLALFAEIERLAPPAAVIASNTSALSITEMAGSLAVPSRVAGMHFFNPVHRMKLVEIVQALESAPRSRTSPAPWGRKRCWCASPPASSPPASTPASATRRSTC
jgi:3-hydroxybutyryl-CoA dehydrogenase